MSMADSSLRKILVGLRYRDQLMVSHAWPATLRESDRFAEFRELLELLVFV